MTILHCSRTFQNSLLTNYQRLITACPSICVFFCPAEIVLRKLSGIRGQNTLRSFLPKLLNIDPIFQKLQGVPKNRCFLFQKHCFSPFSGSKFSNLLTVSLTLKYTFLRLPYSQLLKDLVNIKQFEQITSQCILTLNSR